MANAKITLFSFYRWFKIVNLDLFSEMKLPDGIDRDRLINTILLRGGEFEVQFDDADLVKAQIGIVSENWFDTFKRWYEALSVEYAPLENYDRIENWTDTSEGSSTSDANGSSRKDTNNKVSAFNSSSLVDDTSSGDSDSNESHASGSANSTSTHEGRVHGNIGVTTSSKMLEEFMLTRERFGNLYEHIADVILREIVIPIY